MAIALDATAATGTAGADPITIAAFTATPNTVIVVDVGVAANVVINGVTWGTGSFTQLEQILTVGAIAFRVASFMSVTGADGDPHDVEVDLASGPLVAQCARITSYSGVELSSVAAAHRTIYSGFDASDGDGHDLTVADSENNDLVHSCNLTAATAIVSNHTSVGNNNNIAGDGRSFGVQYQMASGPNTVMSWTGDNFCGHIAFALVPAIEGRTLVIPGRRLYVVP